MEYLRYQSFNKRRMEAVRRSIIKVIRMGLIKAHLYTEGIIAINSSKLAHFLSIGMGAD